MVTGYPLLVACIAPRQRAALVSFLTPALHAGRARPIPVAMSIMRERARALSLEAELCRILGEQLIHAVFQPIVDLDSGAIVAYEALARGPRGSTLERPDLLFAQARESGLVAELDWACRAAAFRGALDARLSTTLFVNVEPSSLDADPPDWLSSLLERVVRELDVVVELTERALTDHPAAMLARVERLRRLGLGVALDDVGADRRSLALMPFVAPDVIKLDLRLVQDHPSPAIAAIVHAVNAEAERSGAILLAEGIETPAQREVALALGARYGQGWLFGRPGALPPSTPENALRRTRPAPSVPTLDSPYEVVQPHVRPRRGTKHLLLAISRHLE